MRINYPQIPSLQHGKENSFYSHGISIGNAYNVGNSTFILFMGWQNLEDQHWRGDIGRIKLIDNLQMKVTPDIPFIGIDHEDKVSLSYPFVLFDKGIYKMWYGSTIKWDAGNNEMTHVIKYATSVDAVTWVKHGLAIPFEIGIAQAFSKPSVLLDELGYHMWFSFRSGTGEKYRIGYAFSKDGENWVRDVKNSGIDVSKKGWDSDMVCYPYVFNHGDNTYMLYNGNNYGKDGFGLAILEKNKT